MPIPATHRYKHFPLGRLRTLVCWGLLAVLFSVPLPLQGAELVDRIVAIVNDDIITLYELNRALQPYKENIETLGYPAEQKRSALFEFRQRLLKELIRIKLTEQEVKRYKIAVSEEEIDNYIERIKENKYLTDEDLREGLIEQGLTMEAYRDEIKQQIQRTRLVNREVKSKVVITKEDVAAYYDAHQDIYGGRRQYHLWNLLVRVPGSAGEIARQAARNELETYLTQLEQGTPFKDVVQEANAEGKDIRGSDLGLFSLEELSTQLQKTVGSMEAKQYSDIFETDIGFQIVYLQDVVASQPRPLSEVESEIQDQLYKEIVDTKFQVWVEELQKRSHIKVIN